MMTKTIFTISAGRTGTAWLAEFLTRNQSTPCIHEPLEIEDFGVAMPDIRLMRSFNTYGNNPEVQEFWRRKLEMISANDVYSETNHTLGKCGLIENLAESDLTGDATIIILRRDLVKQAVSYLVRNDFGNITIAWQWYLHPSYRKKIINPEPFLSKGQIGMALWYCYEMEARQAYYKRLYADKMRMVEVKLDDIVKPDGAQQFWSQLGGEGQCELPERKNENRAEAPDALKAKIAQIVTSSNFDGDKLAKDAIAAGFSFTANSS